ncbi:8132_t:CDS:2 [Entrophospora sp. SA101]|nr:8132_t:CDS:2 [Entrophospora sp. SA101]
MTDPPNAPPIKRLSSTIQELIRNLRNVSRITLGFRNEFFESKILLIKEKRAEFRLVAIDIIYQCDSLVKFGKKLMIFFESCSDMSIPDGDLLEFLRLLLTTAKRNKTATKAIQSTIKSLADDLKTLHNELIKFDLNNMNNIDPKTNKKKKNAESDKKVFSAISVTAGVIDGVLFLGLSDTADSNATIKGKEAKVLDAVLSEKKDQMKVKSEGLQDVSSQISSNLHEMENFWVERIAFLETLIEQFESNSNRGTRPNKLIIGALEEEWKEIIGECKGCSRDIRNEIENDLNNQSIISSPVKSHPQILMGGIWAIPNVADKKKQELELCAGKFKLKNNRGKIIPKVPGPWEFL